MSRSPLPSPLSEAVQVVDVELLPLPEIVQTGEPPLLKCGLAAIATADTPANRPTAATTTTRTRVRTCTVRPPLSRGIHARICGRLLFQQTRAREARIDSAASTTSSQPSFLSKGV